MKLMTLLLEFGLIIFLVQLAWAERRFTPLIGAAFLLGLSLLIAFDGRPLTP